jgi:AraC-like DNA-binding protein
MQFDVTGNAVVSLFTAETPARFQTATTETPQPAGLLQNTTWQFECIAIALLRAPLTAPLIIELSGSGETITMLFNLRGKLHVNADHELAGSQHNLFYHTKGSATLHAEALHLELFAVQFQKLKFLQLLHDCPDALQTFCEQVNTGSSAALSAKPLNTNLQVQTVINSLLQCTYTGGLQQLFCNAKVQELLVLLTESYVRSKQPQSLYLKKEYDRERILFARDYLLKNMDYPPTLTELANIAGINVFKLKRGFKETFGQTVFEYLAETRLELAKNDLLNTDKSVTEIAFELGYSSLQHFSGAFKKKFGVAPGGVRGA